jgi:hypothetical protein
MAKVMIELLKYVCNWSRRVGIDGCMHRSCAAIMKPKQGDNRQVESITWFIPSFKKACQTAITTCTMVNAFSACQLSSINSPDQADKLNPKSLTRGSAFAELRTLLGIANLRADKDKTTIVLFLAGQIVRLSLQVSVIYVLPSVIDFSVAQLDVQGALAHTLRQISGVVVKMQEAPQADRLRYCYWAGRWHLLEHRVGVVSALQANCLEH